MTLGTTMAHERRNDESVSDYFKTKKAERDSESGRQVVKIFSGGWHVSKGDGEMLATILGSCVAACIRDPIARVGGMNHFLLPGSEGMITPLSEAARYGVFAMENLINGVLKLGGHKDRLEFKVFGGGNVIHNSARIGSKNAAFVRNFLKQEGFRIASEDLEGDFPRRVHYFPDTGKVMMRKLKRKEDMMVTQEEARYSQTINSKTVEGDIDLF